MMSYVKHLHSQRYLSIFPLSHCITHITKQTGNHPMSWEHPLQYLNHHTQPYCHYVSASGAAHQIFQFADPIPVCH